MVISTRSNDSCAGCSTSRARRIAPAHVPEIGLRWPKHRNGSRSDSALTYAHYSEAGAAPYWYALPGLVRKKRFRVDTQKDDSPGQGTTESAELDANWLQA